MCNYSNINMFSYIYAKYIKRVCSATVVISDKKKEKQQLWIYNLKDKQLLLSFEDFILFKIEEI